MPKPSKTTSKESTPVPAITVDRCTIKYDDRTVLDGITFAIEQGKVAAVIGPNGSGKTTLIKAIVGLLPISSGEIRIFGKHLHSVRNLIGYVPQRFDFDRTFPITVREFMDLARHPHCPPTRITEKIREVGLSPKTLDAHLGSLSGGQMQRVLIAQAILNNPRILILDEPASGIDIAGEATFYDIVRHLNVEHDTTVLIVSHDIASLSAVVDTVVCVNKTLLCYGPPDQALTARKVGELFGPESRLFHHPGHDHRDDPDHDRAHRDDHDHGHDADHPDA